MGKNLNNNINEPFQKEEQEEFVKKAKKSKLRENIDSEYFSAILFNAINETNLIEDKKIFQLANILSISIHEPNFFKLALIHRSLMPLFQKKFSNADFYDLLNFERLEYLGDSIFNFIITDYLFHKYPNLKEGELSSMRSKLINRNILGETAKQLGISNLIQTSNNARNLINSGNVTILSNALESIIGAIYLDSGFATTQHFVYNKVLPILMKIHALDSMNYKSELMEFVQSYGVNFPIYKVLWEEGPAHLKRFLIGVYINEKLVGTAIANSKKDAEQFAAKKVLNLSNFLL